MYGELTALEALCRSIIENEVSSFLISVPNPKDEKSTLDLSSNQYHPPKISIDTSGNSPYITIDIYLFAKILSIDANTDYLDDTFLEAVANSTNKHLSSMILNYLYKTSTEVNACINHFDKIAMKNFLTTQDWKNYDWISNYSNAVFDVRVHTKTNSSLLLTET